MSFKTYCPKRLTRYNVVKYGTSTVDGGGYSYRMHWTDRSKLEVSYIRLIKEPRTGQNLIFTNLEPELFV